MKLQIILYFGLVEKRKARVLCQICRHPFRFKVSWKFHLTELFKKLARTAGLFYKIRHYEPLAILMLLCHVQLASFLTYCISVWGSTYATYIGPIFILPIKGSIEPTHRSVCSDVRKLLSMDVLKLQSTKADWNTNCPFHILANIYSNLLDISTSYFIKILSYRERLDVDFQRTKMHLSFGFQG